MGNTKNYKEQGGDKWVVGGTLEVTVDGKINIEGTQITRSTNQVNSNASTVTALKDDFNELLLKLKTAGLMKVD